MQEVENILIHDRIVLDRPCLLGLVQCMIELILHIKYQVELGQIYHHRLNLLDNLINLDFLKEKELKINIINNNINNIKMYFNLISKQCNRMILEV